MMEVVLGCLIASNLFGMFSLWIQMNSLKAEIRASSSDIKAGFSAVSFEIPSLTDIREDLMDVIGNMRTPTALDHAMGVFSQIMMMKQRAKMNPEQLINSVEPEWDDHGTP